METANCLNCGEEFDHKPLYCCSGLDCGCEGLDQQPVICSSKCWDEYSKDDS